MKKFISICHLCASLFVCRADSGDWARKLQKPLEADTKESQFAASFLMAADLYSVHAKRPPTGWSDVESFLRPEAWIKWEKRFMTMSEERRGFSRSLREKYIFVTNDVPVFPNDPRRIFALSARPIKSRTASMRYVFSSILTNDSPQIFCEAMSDESVILSFQAAKVSIPEAIQRPPFSPLAQTSPPKRWVTSTLVALAIVATAFFVFRRFFLSKPS